MSIPVETAIVLRVLKHASTLSPTFTQTKKRLGIKWHKVERDISRESECTPVEIDAVTFKSVLVQALGSLHGKVGSAISVDVIKFEATSMEAIIRVKESGLVKLWSALTLLSYYKERRCVIRVIQVSPYLLSLAADSRQWKIKEKEVAT